MKTSPSADLVSTAEACALLNITRYTLRNWAAKGLLQLIKIRGKNWFRKEEVVNLRSPMRLVTIDEACEILGIVRRTLDNRIKKGLLKPIKIGKRYYFSREQVEYLARFTVRYAVARQRLGMGAKEFAAWVETGRIKVLKITAHSYVDEDDIKVAAALLKRYNMRITQASQKGLNLQIWQRYVRDGKIQALFVSTYCYVIKSEIEKVINDRGYTPYRAAKRLGISVADLDALIEQGLLVCQKTSDTFRRIYEHDILEYLSRCGEGGK